MGELCFNLWYYLRSDQDVFMLAARAYVLAGSDEFKGKVLEQLSASDWALALSQAPPPAFRSQRSKSVPYSAIAEFGVEALYADLFKQVQAGLPSGLRTAATRKM